MGMENIDGLPLAPRARGALAAAVHEARQRKHGFVGTEHLLLGMLAEPNAVATRILARLGVLERIRDDLVAAMDAPGYPSAGPPPMSVTDWELRHELLRRRERDQAVRTGMCTRGDESHTFIDKLQRVDRDNTAWLRTVPRDRGWPGRSQVGEDAAAAAWLLAQHADHDPKFQRECLGLMEQAVERGEATAVELAYLTDRVLLAEGHAQRYGTQFRHEPETGEPQPAPIEDPARVDELRAGVGLEPLAAYRECMRLTGPAADPFSTRTKGDLAAALRTQEAELRARFEAMPAGELTSPRTPSRLQGAAAWSAKDHLAHLVRSEQTFRDLVERVLAGDTDALLMSHRGSTPEDREAYVDHENQRHVDEHRHVSLDDLLASLAEARKATVELIEALPDDALATPLRGASGEGFSLGRLLGASGRHARAHLGMIDAPSGAG